MTAPSATADDGRWASVRSAGTMSAPPAMVRAATTGTAVRSAESAFSRPAPTAPPEGPRKRAGANRRGATNQESRGLHTLDLRQARTKRVSRPQAQAALDVPVDEDAAAPGPAPSAGCGLVGRLQSVSRLRSARLGLAAVIGGVEAEPLNTTPTALNTLRRFPSQSGQSDGSRRYFWTAQIRVARRATVLIRRHVLRELVWGAQRILASTLLSRKPDRSFPAAVQRRRSVTRRWTSRFEPPPAPAAGTSSSNSAAPSGCGRTRPAPVVPAATGAGRWPSWVPASRVTRSIGERSASAPSAGPDGRGIPRGPGCPSGPNTRASPVRGTGPAAGPAPPQAQLFDRSQVSGSPGTDT